MGEQLFSNIDPLPYLLLNMNNVTNDYRNREVESLVQDKYHIQNLFVQLSQIHPDHANWLSSQLIMRVGIITTLMLSAGVIEPWPSSSVANQLKLVSSARHGEGLTTL